MAGASSSRRDASDEGEIMRLRNLNLAVASVAMAILGCGVLGPASAMGGVLCSTATNPCTSKWATPTTLDFSLKSGASWKFTDTPGNTLDTCTASTVKGKLTANPSGGQATIENSELAWGSGSSCLVTTDTIAPGKLKIDSKGGGAGTIYSDAKIEITIVIFGGSCNYALEAGGDFGELRESLGEATSGLVVNAVFKKTSGSFLCPETARSSAEYTVTSPSGTTLYVSTS
jgi:hypothetical protein